MSFEIFTDSSASLSLEMIERYRLRILSLTDIILTVQPK